MNYTESPHLQGTHLRYLPLKYLVLVVLLSFSFNSSADDHNSDTLVCGKSENAISKVTGNTSFQTTSRLNVRIGPSKKCTIIEVLPNKQAVTKLKRIQTPEREWAHITWFEDGVDKVGWVSGTFLEETTSDKKPTAKEPIVETPVVETPVVETPVVEAPVVETPVVETPVVETPVVETPVVETPVVETPVVETPVVETPVVESTVVETPVVARRDNQLSDIAQWKGVLNKMEHAFEQGNANRLSNLYTINGRENSLVGADTILVYYAAEFRKTADRSITFEPKVYRPGFVLNETSAVVEGKMISEQIIIELGRRSKVTSNFRMVLIKQNDIYRIKSFDTEPIWQ